MGAAAIVQVLLQLTQAGFALVDIANKVHTMNAAGATDAEIHAYLRALAQKSQQDLENA